MTSPYAFPTPEDYGPRARAARARTTALLYPLVQQRPELRGSPIPRRGQPGEEVIPSEQVNAVPEPGTLALLFAGLGVGLAATRRARRRSRN